MSPEGERSHVYAVIVREVVSAGVLEVDCGLAPWGDCRWRVCLAGVVLPEPGTSEGRTGKDWTEAWVGVHTRRVWPPALLLTSPDWSPSPVGAVRPGRVTAPDGCPLDVALVAAGIGRWRRPTTS